MTEISKASNKFLQCSHETERKLS